MPKKTTKTTRERNRIAETLRRRESLGQPLTAEEELALQAESSGEGYPDSTGSRRPGSSMAIRPASDLARSGFGRRSPNRFVVAQMSREEEFKYIRSDLVRMVILFILLLVFLIIATIVVSSIDLPKF